MRLGITKACAPVCAMQGARAIEVHCPGNVIEIIKIGGIVITHGLCFFFLKDLEESRARPEGFQSAGDDGCEDELIVSVNSKSLFGEVYIDPAICCDAFRGGCVYNDFRYFTTLQPLIRTDHIPF